MLNKKFSFRDIKNQTEETILEESAKHSLLFNIAIVLVVVTAMAGILRLTHDFITTRGFFAEALGIKTAYAADVIPNQAQLISQSHTNVNIKPDTGFTFTLTYKNIGSTTWTKKKVYLKSSTTALKFRQKSWPDPYLPASLKEDSVAPGEIGTFVFALQSPTNYNLYSGDFLLVNDNVMIQGGDINVIMNVVDDPSKIIKVVVKEPTPTNPVNTSNVCTLNFRMAGETDGTETLGSSSVSCIEKFQLPPQGPNIRVGLFYLGSTFFPDKSVQLVNDHAWQVLDSDDTLLASVEAGLEITLFYSETKKEYSFDFEDRTIRTMSYLKFNNFNNGMFTINNYDYRPSYSKKINYNDYIGNLELRHNDCSIKNWGTCEGKVWMIEELSLETYLKGIQETSNSDPIEYLKAMSIAARTYALYQYDRNTKHNWEFYHVDAHYDQVYKGYVPMYLTPNIGVGVDATTGITATYDNKIIVAPYFSHSDGRTRSFLEVWKNDVPYLISKPAPYSEGKTLFGHGVGIDAYDAQQHAKNDAWTYDQILNYYYTGINLEKIY